MHPLAAIQTEYSLWERDVEEKVLPEVRRLGIGLVAYSPVGRGILSGRIKSPKDFDESDFRRNHPRFTEENFKHNLKLVEEVKEIASANDVTPAQVALAWVLRQGNDIVAIPGTKHVRYLEENARAADLKLPESVWSAGSAIRKQQ